ncbi:hypothetical protein HanXRQr2_Chr02g0076441 [Helianthus annuus]|uniref:Uncharacterized protein n=1 Tax=Helianthus annuus TaxID=4232 RepID=A0A251S0W3_HELAN|nr:hypothetical protein HanXRQr2_Chr02g0076441 [Helianthus annuus]KAJ0605492.1 hypothetical protein HanHA300_Chr02g0063651 [Helianthus annuus]KAJ0616318.1 hypothetical protein HanIR_Chr02g0089291 [Helianthus annuus]KAJ0619506.1 hypothetical protein HanHA89_Chr02g0072101 [Helianthus annuus]KAJ0777968.1 hypothetical protein HanLR1_Chr02g0066551 [Helianthus annuus]
MYTLQVGSVSVLVLKNQFNVWFFYAALRCGFKNFSFHTPSLPPNSPRPIFLFLKTPKIPHIPETNSTPPTHQVQCESFLSPGSDLYSISTTTTTNSNFHKTLINFGYHQTLTIVSFRRWDARRSA